MLPVSKLLVSNMTPGGQVQVTHLQARGKTRGFCLARLPKPGNIHESVDTHIAMRYCVLMTTKLNSRTREVAEHIRDRKPFQTYGALYAEEVVHPYVHSGRLNEEETAQLRADLPEIVYVVFSYSTPIAWAKRDGSAHRVAQKFSVTTSHHQGKLYLLGD